MRRRPVEAGKMRLVGEVFTGTKLLSPEKKMIDIGVGQAHGTNEND